VAKRLLQQAVWWLTGCFSRHCDGLQVGSAGSVMANRLVQQTLWWLTGWFRFQDKIIGLTSSIEVQTLYTLCEFDNI
jgi:hypothetical protein